MALYAPFYAGKDAPMKKWTRKVAKSVKSAKSAKSAKAKTPQAVAKTLRSVKAKAPTVLSPKSKCSEAARRLSKCRGTKRNNAHKLSCKQASKTLYGCRKK